MSPLRPGEHPDRPGPLRSVPVLVAFAVAVTVCDFATYAAGWGDRATWMCTAGMLTLQLRARVHDRLDGRRLVAIAAAEAGGFVALGLPFGLGPLTLLRMALVNVVVVAAAVWAYQGARHGRSEWYPSGPVDALRVVGLIVGGTALAHLLGGYFEPVFVPGDVSAQLRSLVQTTTSAVLAVLTSASLFYPPRRQYTRRSWRLALPAYPAGLAAVLLPYLLPGWGMEWLVLLIACWFAFIATPRTIGVAVGFVVVIQLLLIRTGHADVSDEGILPASLFLALLFAVAVALAYCIVAFREQQGRLEAELAAAAGREAGQARLLASVIGSMTDGVVILDERQQVEGANPAARALLGDLAPATTAQDWVSAYRLRTAAGSPLDPDLLLHTLQVPDGESASLTVLRPGDDQVPDRYYDLTVRPFRNGGRRFTLIVISDNTAQHARRHELEAFAGTVAHDLKNPLAAMALWVDTAMLDVTEDPKAGRSAVLEAVAAGERMTRLIDDYLAYTVTREGELRWVTVDLGAVVADVTAVHAADPVVFDVDVATRVRGDRALLDQLLANLVGNAVKYRRPDTTAHVSIRARADAQPGWARVVIADDGIGLGDDAADLFVPFARTAAGMASKSGIGLGLALCHAIVARHGGRIEGHTNAAGGATFEFTLPLAATT